MGDYVTEGGAVKIGIDEKRDVHAEGDDEPIDRPKKMVFDDAEDADGFVPERVKGGEEVVFDDVGIVADSPGPAFELFILVDHGFPPVGGFGGIRVEGEEDGFDFEFAFEVEEGFEKNAVVFRDDIRIPVADLVDHFKGG